MTVPLTQWEAVGGVAHAWMSQCEGYVSLCGREVSGLYGQRSGILCAQCKTSSGWAEQTGEASYLTSHQSFEVPASAQVHVHAGPHPRQRSVPRRRPRAVPPSRLVTSPFVEEPAVPVAPITPVLQRPETLEAYQQLPEPEQRYWAPLMLARQGQETMWDQVQETAEQFQLRCYTQLVGARS